ncbi:lysylphosphatidylglycerol synthase transmembrane domain-containing protein [Microbacter margulisiae]|uniref:Lysylphosphatidylglycerol synthase TM region n=1 Tax=Microbacter margulisiae TaxID=1350067 RepID=A0A7W5DNN4_9PORP|nr:lysylphosphatidylglycerol synthase transmembrane domain-containing protein [Microbacter margulisiae]MBB3186142.1 hypothetical protein [Microbacter margulisiae]
MLKLFRAYYPIVKWTIVILSYGFLIYKIEEFIHTPASNQDWFNISLYRWGWLLMTLILLPGNLLIESIKWRFLVSKVEPISFATAFKSLFSGLATGFFTPNRLGEYPGRVVYLQSENRWKGITFGFIGTLAQTITLLSFGLLSFWLLMVHHPFGTHKSDTLRTIIFSIATVLSFTIYLSLPRLVRLLRYFKIHTKMMIWLRWFTLFSTRELTFILLLAMSRYLVFCLQLYFMLLFCDIKIPFLHGMIAIAAYYLFVTFTPSISFSEAAIRGSYAVMFIGLFSENAIAAATAGVLIWFINAVIPMIIGSIFFSRTKI